MDNITIGLYVSAGMLVMVLLGMRVAFAAGMAGLLAWCGCGGMGLIMILRASESLQISVKVAGLTPHSKVSAQVLSLIPGVHIDRLSCLSCKIDRGVV